MSMIVIGLASLVVFVVFVFKPEVALYALFLEAIWGGNGHWLEFGGGLTPRYLLLPLAVLAFLARKIAGKLEFRKPRIWVPLVAFGCVLVFGIAEALVFANPDPLSEPQVWLFLCAYPLILDLRRSRSASLCLVRIVLWGSAAMSIFQLALMVLLNLRGYTLLPLLEILDGMRITTPIIPGTNFIYVFWGNCAMAGMAVAICTLLLARRSSRALGMSRSQLWLIESVCVMGMVCGMTRGVWGQLLIVAALVGLDLAFRRKLPWRLILVSLFVAALAVSLAARRADLRDAFIKRFDTLLPSNRQTLDPEDSIVLKAEETRNLLRAIEARPFFGYGFGEGHFHAQFHLPQRSHNFFLSFAVKTGLVGLSILAWLLAHAVLKAAWTAHRARRLRPEIRDVLAGFAYGLVGVIAASISNPHLGTPAMILIIGLMLALTDITQFEIWRREHATQHLYRQLQLEPSA